MKGLKAGTFTLRTSISARGEANRPALRFDANYRVVYPIDYDVWSVPELGDEEDRVHQDQVARVRAGWREASGDLVAAGSLRLRDVRFDVRPAPLLGRAASI